MATKAQKSPRAIARPVRDARTETALKLYVVLLRASSAVTRRLVPLITKNGLTGAEFGVLEALYHRGPMLLGEVQRRLLVSSGGITFLVDRLVAKGLVARRECPGDRRAKYADLTPTGERLIDEIFPRHAAEIADLMATLDAGEQRNVTELLKRLGMSAAEAVGEE
jgi:MarR family 2-MHQ and catechol resistance regulon transcriptional repressor